MQKQRLTTGRPRRLLSSPALALRRPLTRRPLSICLPRALIRRPAPVRRSAPPLLNAFFNEAPIAFGICDSRLRMVQVNGPMARLLGCTPADLEHRSAITTFAVFAPPLLPLLRSALESGESVADEEIRFRRLDGEERYMRVCLSPLSEGAGAIDAVGIVLRDVTSRRRYRDQQSILAAVSSVLSSSLDPAHTLESLCHLMIPELAHHCEVLVPEADGSLRSLAAACIAPLESDSGPLLSWSVLNSGASFGARSVLNSGQMELVTEITPSFIEAASPTPELKERLAAIQPSSYICLPLLSYGKVLGVMSFFFTGAMRRHHIEDLELLEEIGRRTSITLEHSLLYREALNANRLKDQFLATLSHELRTPLNVVLAWSDQLLGRATPERQKRGIEVIHRNTITLARLIDDLLDASRIIAGKMYLEPRPTCLVTLIETVRDSLLPALEEKRLSIEHDFDETAGEIPEIWVDTTRMQQVLWNLLSNAIKFSPESGVIHVHLRRSGDSIEIRVTDQGQGIEPEFLPFVFDRFRQATDIENRRHGGLGLGLAIVRHLVELHGGSVAVQSQGPGKGSSFQILLPILES